jgi:chemotaxis family two-component system response regulator Rcp1
MEPAGIKPFEILVVDDSPQDIRLIRDAFSLWKGSRRLQVFLNGVEALDYLKKGSEETLLDLILLDWNLPGIRGERILQHLKNDKRLREIPVVIFTSSSAPADRRRAAELGADRFITKPLDIDDFFNVIADLEDFVNARGARSGGAH